MIFHVGCDGARRSGVTAGETALQFSSGDGLLYLGGVNPAEICFDQRDFRPLVETEADISVFTEMLTPSKQKVDA